MRAQRLYRCVAPDIRKNIHAYWKLKCERAERAIAMQQGREVGPAESGILAPKTKQPKKNVSRHLISEGHDSKQMSGMHENV